MAVKNVSIIVEGSGQPERTVQLLPGTTVRDALIKVGLEPSDVYMSAPDGQRLLATDEDLFEIADPGDRLSVSSAMRAGFLGQ